MAHREGTPQFSQPPTGWRRTLARLPIRMFRAGLGPVFGKRLLLLNHTGRVSGRRRQVVLEVVAHDSRRGTWTVASGFGPGSQWYRNLRREPHTVIQYGKRRHRVTASFLSPDEGADVMARYESRHPLVARVLGVFTALPTSGSEESFREAARSIPFVRLDATRRPGDQEERPVAAADG
ncbi:nitroreductase family deazaflavin-dependent oxidoreductase [Streptomyces aureocirculatus]|uniref:nitroreductase family deazaflavin-dependent oxidoreductase n=1 Tax=Streptomyces aureocirculatus TaxID=67275 RepID=UPI0004C87018|nr:nitroreductase family deazaflavin-dependent oxidoreductase [Streptomyces aureocirculatus]